MTEAVAAALLDQLQHAGIQPTGVTADSRRVASGDLFLAFPGLTVDGRNFIEQALAAGACAVIVEDGGQPLPSLPVPVIAAAGVRALAGFLADAIYGRPSARLWMAGVTGTNGKTTITQWLARALSASEVKCGVIGTLGSGFPGALTEGRHTTPDAPAVHERIAQLLAEGAKAVTMEVSSIGLHQGRVNGVHFDVAIFTNLSRDHLDYHGDMQTYAEAKADLFHLGIGHAIVNLDDAFGVELGRRMVARNTPVTGYTMLTTNVEAVPGAHVLAADSVTTTASGIRFIARWKQQQMPVSVHLVATFNVSNLLAVMAALLVRGMSLEQAVRTCARLQPPEGRMQIVGGVGEPLVLIDYAHTPDALEKVFLAARDAAQVRQGALIGLFGCGGDRDAGKRPMMAEVASRICDQVWLTSDNPRSEDPQSILDQMAAGAGSNARCELDRARAIEMAITTANADDVVVLAGKGHENYQEIAGVRYAFADIEHARAALKRWHAQAGGQA